MTLPRRLSAAVLLCFVLSSSLIAQGTPEDYQRAEQFPQIAKDKVFKTRVVPHWFDGNTKFWYRNDLRDGAKEFLLVEADKGKRDLAFDHKRLAEGLTKASGTAYTADKLPLHSLAWVKEGKALEFGVERIGWSCDLATYECTKTGKEVRPPPPDQPDFPRRPPQPPDQPRQRPGNGPVASPDSRWTAVVKDDNVYMVAKDVPGEIQLTRNGTSAHTYGAISWSPDSKVLVAFRTKKSPPLKAYILDSSPRDQLRPKVIEQSYRLPGDDLDIHELCLFNVETKEALRADVEPIDAERPPALRWKKDRRHFTYQKTDRDHTRVRILEVDAHTGTARTAFEERTDTRIDARKAYVHTIDDDEMLWASERDGWDHLYLIDLKTGKVKNQISKGEWVVRNVVEADDKTRQVWFMAGGRHSRQDPYFIHYYRVNYDGTGLVALTEGDGSHSVNFSPDRKYLLDSYSRVDMAPVTELRRASDGGLVCVLEKADMQLLLDAGWRAPESFCFKGRDGRTDIWGVVYRPTKLDEKKKYPVIEHIYAGPWTASVPKTFTAARSEQALAELGFIVVQIDGMGLPGRSKAFHDVSHKNHADAGLPDRILWISALAQRYPYVDATRVGIYGHSGGGYSSVSAMLNYPEFYKVCVSSSGNHDPRTYNLGYSEQWMGYPVGDHYKEQSNITNAHKLKGKLLLIHGEADTNVIPSMTTMKLVDALIKANKDFDLLILPGRNHGIASPYVTHREWDYFVKHLLKVEPPDRNSTAGK